MRKLILEESLTRYCLVTEIAIAEYHSIITRLLDSINLARRDEIAQFLVNPEPLMNALSKIRMEKGSDAMILDPQESNFFEYLSISEISLAIHGKRLICSIVVPILEKSFYRIYNIHSVPSMELNGQLYFIRSPYTHVIVNLDRTMTTPVDEYYIKNCKVLQDTRICKR